MLTERQQLTIEHLNQKGIYSPDQIIKFCLLKLSQPGQKRGVGGGIGRRKHSKQYYQEIFEHYASEY